MDPVVQALIEHYQMPPELAQRVAANLQRPGAALDAYPAVAGMIKQPAPQASPSSTPSGPVHKGGQAVRSSMQIDAPNPAIHPAALAPTPQQQQQINWNAQLQASRMLQQKHQTNQQSQRDNDLAAAQSQQDAIDQQLRQARVQHYNSLIQQTQQGKDIGKENREWLAKVHEASQYAPPADNEDALLRKPGSDGYGAATSRAYADKMIGAALNSPVAGVPAFPGAPGFAAGLQRGVNNPTYQARPIDLRDLQAMGINLEDATNFLYPQGR